MQHKRH